MKNKGNSSKKIPWIWMIAYLPFLLLLYYIVTNYFHERNTTIPEVCSEKTCFTVELARTAEQQQQGLMYRETMGEEYGMLFIFPDTTLHNFWMKNTRIPLDIIWINDQFQVVRIFTAQPCITDPCTIYAPETGSTYVLEINAGLAEKYEIVEGSVMKFRNIK